MTCIARNPGLSGYNTDRCRCRHCRSVKADYTRRRTRRLAYGTWQPWVDTDPVREHLRHLTSSGIGLDNIAKLAGLARATVAGIVYPRNANRPAAKHCRASTAQAILAVKPTMDNVSDHVTIDATGTLRRLRALVAQGHPMRDLGYRLPMHHEAARRLIRNGNKTGRCTAIVARAARDLYDQLWADQPQGWNHDHARNLANRLGWAPPGAWDDDTIDDPTARPHLGEPNTDIIDHVLIDRALAGQPVRLTRTNRRAALAAGIGRRMPLHTLGRRLHMSHATVRHYAARAERTG